LRVHEIRFQQKFAKNTKLVSFLNSLLEIFFLQSSTKKDICPKFSSILWLYCKHLSYKPNSLSLSAQALFGLIACGAEADDSVRVETGNFLILQ